jgi:hypothetical protein
MSDSEDSFSYDDATYEKVVDSLLHPAPSPTKNAVGSRATLPKLYHNFKSHGKIVVTHPFFSHDNDMDKVIVHHLLVDKPYLAAHENVQQEWKECMDNINKEEVAENPIFILALTSKTVKSRFEAYMKFAAQKKTATPFNSGSDDEEELCEIQQGIEDMLEQYEAFMDEKITNKTNAATKM